MPCCKCYCQICQSNCAMDTGEMTQRWTEQLLTAAGQYLIFVWGFIIVSSIQAVYSLDNST